MSETSTEIIDDEREVKERGISFRVSDEVYERIESQARNNGETPSGWCRKIVLGEAAKDCGMTASDRAIYVQVGVIRHLFGRYLKEVLAPEIYERLRREAEQHQVEIADRFLLNYTANKGR